MVDAINGQSGIKPQDLAIDWNACTAQEVLEYQEEGQEVPDAILTWAEDMAKTAQGDEITYEMASENPEATSTGEVEELDAGANLKTQLDSLGKTPLEQAGIFAEESRKQSDMVRALESEMENILKRSEETTARVQEQTNNILSQIQTLNARKEALKNDNTTPFAGLQATQIDAQIKQLGQFGLSTIDTAANDVYSVTNGIGDALQTATDTDAIGTQSSIIGRELYNQYNSGMFIVPREARDAIRYGESAIQTAASGTNIFNATAEDNIPYEDAVDANKASITRASGATGITETEEGEETTPEEEIGTPEEPPVEGENETDVTATEQAEKDAEAEKTEAELDPTLADTSITTDPNEILKRKERKGLA